MHVNPAPWRGFRLVTSCCCCCREDIGDSVAREKLCTQGFAGFWGRLGIGSNYRREKISSLLKANDLLEYSTLKNTVNFAYTYSVKEKYKRLIINVN